MKAQKCENETYQTMMQTSFSIVEIKEKICKM
jgi:hypothetical protein